MKKIFSLLTAAAVSAALALSASAADFGRVTVMGDSIATGYGLDGYTAGDNYSAPVSFSSLIKNNDSESVVNLAVDGRTSAALLEAVRGEWAGSDDLLNCDSVIISIGGNDFLMPMVTAIQEALVQDSELISQILSEDGDFSEFEPSLLFERYSEAVIEAAQNVDIAQTKANLEAIVAEIKAANPDCKIYVLTVYDPFEGNEEMEEIYLLAEDKLSGLNGAVWSLEGVTVVDVYSAFKGHAAEYTNITEADIHPNSAGHGVIYSLLCAAEENGGEVPTMAPVNGDAPPKGSPDTGAAGIAAAAGAAMLAGAGAVLSRRKRS